jgi:hypothetical protein
MKAGNTAIAFLELAVTFAKGKEFKTRKRFD